MIKLEKRLCLKEQLCDDELSTRIYLLLKVLNVVLIAGAFGMAVGITWEGMGCV